MKIKQLGQSSFTITSDTGTEIIPDPYSKRGKVSYGEIGESADVATVSHKHSDHNNVAAVVGNPEVINGTTTTNAKGIKLKEIPCHHDVAQGKQRGKNIIFCFEVNEIRICHPSDLGHPLSDKDAAELDKVDILLIPGGSLYR